MLQSARFGKVGLTSLAEAGHRIKISGQAALIFGEQPGDELARLLRTHADQIFPTCLRRRSSGNHDTPISDADLIAVEIQHGGEGS